MNFLYITLQPINRCKGLKPLAGLVSRDLSRNPVPAPAAPGWRELVARVHKVFAHINRCRVDFKQPQQAKDLRLSGVFHLTANLKRNRKFREVENTSQAQTITPN